MNPGLKDEALGKKNVLMTHPQDQETPCVLTKEIEVPAGKKTTLKLVVGHHPQGDWDLAVNADGKSIYKGSIGGPDAWKDVNVDLTPYAGKTITLDLVNQATGWSFEAGYWAKIEVISE